MKIDIPAHLSDDDLVARVKSLGRSERETTASLIAHLAELHARRLYLGAGFSSLFTYCCEVLHLSELLAAASHKSKRQVEELLVRYFPKADVPPSVRKLPTPSSPSAATLPASLNPPGRASVASQPLAAPSQPVLPALARRPVV